jgi:nitrate reductase assembly molybdenum cofactor insertion protein NarJ
LNQRLKWQLNNLTRELRFVSLNRDQLKLMIFIDCVRQYDRSSQSDRLRDMFDRRRSH